MRQDSTLPLASRNRRLDGRVGSGKSRGEPVGRFWPPQPAGLLSPLATATKGEKGE